MAPPADVLERERRRDLRFGIYLTVREMELVARKLEVGAPSLADRTLAARFREKAHQVRSCT